jgi:hypothetical protein
MKKILCAGVLFALSFTICLLACPDPAFYRPHRAYLNEKSLVTYVGGRLLVMDEQGWFPVDSIGKDAMGFFYTNKVNAE